ncbi:MULTISPECIES: hypothetical protein [unclassified Pseudactinotalea]|uniref:hypothetical protein n=1 Tax=unclassified Pseudactinotalea TaxID=2649176 RepID=UPI00128E5A37|nr:MULTISPECIES: hypothetical protein [unclassified Pseudactinotalea]
MAEKGFPAFRWEVDEPFVNEWYGVTDPEVAAVWGYRNSGAPESFEGLPDDGPQVMQPEPMTDELEALVGADEDLTAEVLNSEGIIVYRYAPDACMNIGMLSVRPNYFEGIELEEQLVSLAGEASRQAQDTEEFESAFTHWNDCVESKGGIRTNNYRELVGGREGFLMEGPPGAAEIAAATIDAECKRDTGLLRTWSQLRAEAEAGLLAQHPGLLTTYLEYMQPKVTKSG